MADIVKRSQGNGSVASNKADGTASSTLGTNSNIINTWTGEHLSLEDAEALHGELCITKNLRVREFNSEDNRGHVLVAFISRKVITEFNNDAAAIWKAFEKKILHLSGYIWHPIDKASGAETGEEVPMYMLCRDYSEEVAAKRSIDELTASEEVAAASAL